MPENSVDWKVVFQNFSMRNNYTNIWMKPQQSIFELSMISNLTGSFMLNN